MEKDIKKQLEIIKRGTAEIISEGELKAKLEYSLKTKKPLIVKAGFDPTAPDIHIGHTVLLRKLRHFQELGHKVIFLIGDATALVGDPSGQSQTRKTLTWEEVEKNAITYEEQVGKILNTKDKNLFERKHNSEWFSRHGRKEKNSHPFAFEQFVELAQRYTVARILERDDFKKRLKENKPISFLELFYPLMQGYDSVELKVDVEIGGTDQKFNMLVGRDLQEAYGQKPQIVITMPLLEGLDGINKMSKSYGNYIGINEPPREIFGKIMSVSDELMYKYYELLTDENLEKVKKMHPMEAKKNLASEIVYQYYSKKEASEAQIDFEKKFQERDPFTGVIPRDIPIDLTANSEEGLLLSNILCSPQILNLVKSKSDFRRLVEQGAIVVNGQKVTNSQYCLEPNKEYCIKVGKTRFSKIIIRIK
ncbi:MAG: tyrosine--tRNA ligase [Candidatus Omnitrophica bacterium]|nr:tyrosine--tRNA ligase [Candidatus Omnitrophota bacterium]